MSALMALRKILLLAIAATGLLGLLRVSFSPPRALPNPTTLAPQTDTAAHLFVVPSVPDTPAQPPDASAFPGITAAPVLSEAGSPGVISHWQGRLVTPLRDRAPEPDADLHLPLRFAFPLSASRTVHVRIERHDETAPDSGVFTGVAHDLPGSVVILSYVGLAQSGVVQLPGERRAYVINGDDTGHIRVTALDLDRAPGCTPPLSPPLASLP